MDPHSCSGPRTQDEPPTLKILKVEDLKPGLKVTGMVLEVNEVRAEQPFWKMSDISYRKRAPEGTLTLFPCLISAPRTISGFL